MAVVAPTQHSLASQIHTSSSELGDSEELLIHTIKLSLSPIVKRVFGSRKARLDLIAILETDIPLSPLKLHYIDITTTVFTLHNSDYFEHFNCRQKREEVRGASLCFGGWACGGGGCAEVLGCPSDILFAT